MEISQKVDVVGYPVEPLRVEMRNGPVNANVQVTDLPLVLVAALGAFFALSIMAVTALRDIRDTLKDLRPHAATAPADAPKPPK